MFVTDGTGGGTTLKFMELANIGFAVDVATVDESVMVAVIRAFPNADGVNSPEEDMDPFVADQVTGWLETPLFATEAVHWLV